MLNSCSWHFNLSILLPCSNHIVINSPKRERLKVHLLLNGVFGVMTMWLVGLMTGVQDLSQVICPVEGY